MASEPSASRAPLLRADGLTRRVDGRDIVHDVTVEVRAGEVVADDEVGVAVAEAQR